MTQNNRASLLIFIIIAELTYSLYLGGCFKHRPKPGEVWEYHPANIKSDPFKHDTDKIIEYFKVLAIKDDYVQYVTEGDTDTSSCTIHWFMLESTKIK